MLLYRKAKPLFPVSAYALASQVTEPMEILCRTPINF